MQIISYRIPKADRESRVERITWHSRPSIVAQMLSGLHSNDTSNISRYNRAFPLSQNSRVWGDMSARRVWRRHIPDPIGFHFAFRERKEAGKDTSAAMGRSMPPCKSFPWTIPYKYSTICISPPRRSARTGHFQDGCRHFARYTPKVLLPTKFQLACSSARPGGYIHAHSYARRKNKRNTTLVAPLTKRLSFSLISATRRRRARP